MPKRIAILGIKDWDYALTCRSHHLAVALAQCGSNVTYIDPLWLPSSDNQPKAESSLNYEIEEAGPTEITRIRAVGGLRPSLRQASCEELYKRAGSLLRDALLRRQSQFDVVIMSMPLDIHLAIAFENAALVADFVDHYAGYFPNLANQQQKFLREAACVFCVSEPLMGLARLSNTHCVFLPNALPPRQPPYPAAKAGMVYAGAINERMGLAWLETVAKQLPSYRLSLFGPIQTRVDSLLKLPNVAYHGTVDHDALMQRLPSYQIGLVPFDRRSVAYYCDPMKAYDYLAADLVVLGAPLPALERLRPYVVCVSDPTEIAPVAARELTLYRSYRLGAEFVRRESWSARAAEMLDVFSG